MQNVASPLILQRNEPPAPTTASFAVALLDTFLLLGPAFHMLQQLGSLSWPEPKGG